jgi:MFS family permease
LGRVPQPAIISFLSELTIVMISIYLPFRAYQLGADSLLVGLVGASGSVVYMFAPFFTGRLSDRVGPKKLLVIGTAIVSTLCLAYTFVGEPVAFVGLRLVEGIGWAMIWPPLEALYSVSGGDLRRSMKMFNLAWGLGAMVSPLVGSFIADGISVEGTFIASAGFMLVALLLSLTMRAGKSGHVVSVKAKGTLHLWTAATLLSYAFVYGFTMTTFSTFFPKFAASIDIELSLWGTILSAMLAGRMVAFLVSERVLGHLGLRRTRSVFLVVSLAFPVCCVLPGQSGLLLVAASFVTGGGLGFVYFSTMVDVLGGPAEGRGRAAGLFESSLGLGSFAGPAIAGALASYGLWTTMLLPAAPIAGVFFAGLSGRRESQSREARAPS